MNDGAILLVEDNPDDVELTLRAFNRNRLTNPVIVARDGVEAREQLFGDSIALEGSRPGEPSPRARVDRAPTRPAMILLDLNLPKVGGLQLLGEIRGHPHTALVPVIVLTSSVEDEDLLAAYQGGANSYIRKPVDFNAFVDVVNKLEMYWLVMNEPAPGDDR